MWGQYYFTTLGAYLARTTNDIYQKTLFLRFPHAVIGFIGIIIMPLIITPFIENKKHRLIVWLCFTGIIILSVSLILHIKEVRSYSLSVFFSSVFLNIFVRYYFKKSIKRSIYYFFGSLTLIFLINSFPPGFLSLTVGVFGYVVLKNIAVWVKDDGSPLDRKSTSLNSSHMSI